jgi:hypothetical protein
VPEHSVYPQLPASRKGEVSSILTVAADKTETLMHLRRQLQHAAYRAITGEASCRCGECRLQPLVAHDTHDPGHGFERLTFLRYELEEIIECRTPPWSSAPEMGLHEGNRGHERLHNIFRP